MFKKTMTYYDLNGTQHTTDLHFNLTTIELSRFSEKYSPGVSLEQYISDAVNSGNNFKIINTLADLVLEAYGKKSDDGLRFVKNPQIREDFENSVVFAEFLEDLIMDEKLALEFTNSLLESKVIKQAQQTQKPELQVVAPKPALHSYTREELEAILLAAKAND